MRNICLHYKLGGVLLIWWHVLCWLFYLRRSTRCLIFKEWAGGGALLLAFNYTPHNKTWQNNRQSAVIAVHVRIDQHTQLIPCRFLPPTCWWCWLCYSMWSQLRLSMSWPPSLRERGHSSCFGSEACGMAVTPRGEGSGNGRRKPTWSKSKYPRKTSHLSSNPKRCLKYITFAEKGLLNSKWIFVKSEFQH